MITYLSLTANLFAKAKLNKLAMLYAVKNNLGIFDVKSSGGLVGGLGVGLCMLFFLNTEYTEFYGTHTAPLYGRIFNARFCETLH